jgi:catechol 2,3-dioxygenase-like lactoylglutathione lyase family enzyme
MSVITVQDIAHVRYAAPDLGAMRSFLEDFGMQCFEAGGRLYGKGTDGRPFFHVTEQGKAEFLAVGFIARSLQDLQALADYAGVPIEESTEPGGGKIVRLVDPDGYRVEVVAGQECGEPSIPTIRDPINSPAEKPRLNREVRMKAAPSHPHRIGHTGMSVSDFRASEKWYKDRFGFITTNEFEVVENVRSGAFMRCDRGNQPADHHTLALLQIPGGRRNLHTAFEVPNIDDLMLGHNYLKAKNRRPFWSLGKHILGSQTFDYWKDPFGNELEHFTDGDVYTADHPPTVESLQSLIGVQWGPSFPGKINPAVLAKRISFISRLWRTIARSSAGDRT